MAVRDRDKKSRSKLTARGRLRRGCGAKMSADLYDEFGNYIGPDIDSDSESGSESSSGSEDDANDGEATTERNTQTLSGSGRISADQKAYSDERGEGSGAARGGGGGLGGDDDDDDEEENDDDDGDVRMDMSSTAIVLHEDKKFYPDAEEVYPGVQVLVQDEDTQGIEEPIIKPVEIKVFSKLYEDAPNLRYSVNFLNSLTARPMLMRNVALVGHLHHGKTTLLDILIDRTFEQPKRTELARKYAKASPRYCDTRIDEQERKLSIKSCPTSLVLEDGRGKTYLINTIDCPGHVNFLDETTAALQAADGVLLVVDAVEGPMISTRRAITQAARAGIPISLCVSKIDRLIHELKLPPTDAYMKLKNVIDQVNDILKSEAQVSPNQARLSPTKGNVCFASGEDGYCFTLESWARLHLRQRGLADRVDAAQFAKRLWGNVYFDPATRKFAPQPSAQARSRARSFVHFILEPLYKIYSQVLGEEPEALRPVLQELHVYLSEKELRLDPRPLLRIVLDRFFGAEATSGFVDLVVAHVPFPGSPENQEKLSYLYTGSDDTSAKSVLKCDANGPLRAHICKLYATPDGSSFRALAKIYSGSLKAGQRVRILGESFSAMDQEDSSVVTIDALSICQARHRILVDRMTAGNWVLIEGISDYISKTATLVADDESLDSVCTFRAPQYDDAAVMKLALEPVNPPDLPKMLHGLRCVSKSYPLLRTKVEESGEHVIFGTGEMYLDCAMQDLREMYAGVEVKATDPMVSFCESVANTSVCKARTETPNLRNSFTTIAAPLEKGLGNAIEQGKLKWEDGASRLGDDLIKMFHWDKLEARSLWAFGPTPKGANVFIDDTINGQVDKSLVESVRDSVVQGFCWATREGPLCDEPMRDVKFRMLNASIASEPIHRGAGFVIPTMRRAAYAAFLYASPRLMEPIYAVEIQAPKDLSSAINRTLQLRRGRLFADAPVPGTPFSLFQAYVPVIDSFGFETDLRAHTQGAAICHQYFDHWDVVPGDPLDDSVILRPLEPSRGQDLAREFMIKTRRRKGLPEDVAVAKYFSPDGLEAYNRARRRLRGEEVEENEEDGSSSDSDSSSSSSSSSNSDNEDEKP